MIRHCSLWKMKPDVSEELMDEIVDRFYGAIEEIPAVLSGHVGRNIGYLAENYDLALTLEFEDLDGYKEGYVRHPLHDELFQTYLKPNIEARVAVQFELRDAPRVSS